MSDCYGWFQLVCLVIGFLGFYVMGFQAGRRLGGDDE